jgi:LPXTG-site transpeptidase (sortase) family protein
LAGTLTLVAVICLVMWAARADQESSGGPVSAPASTAEASASGSAPAPPETATVPGRARPVGLTIPDIDVTTQVTRLGLEADGSVEVPEDPALAGWYRLGPAPGAPGSSVILGHVDSVTGPAVFYRLDELRPGDRLTVGLDDGTSVQFRVHSIRTYPNADFPARKIYGRQGRSQLNLITCGGAYDSSRGGYQSNVVVNARLV